MASFKLILAHLLYHNCTMYTVVLQTREETLQRNRCCTAWAVYSSTTWHAVACVAAAGTQQPAVCQSAQVNYCPLLNDLSLFWPYFYIT